MILLRTCKTSAHIWTCCRKSEAFSIRHVSKTVKFVIKPQVTAQMFLRRVLLPIVPTQAGSLRPLSSMLKVPKKMYHIVPGKTDLTNIRYFSTSKIICKNAEKLDLECWKSLIKSQIVPVREENSVSEENGNNQIDESSQLTQSSLEIHRELVNALHIAGKPAPKSITEEQLQELVRLSTKKAKLKHLKFLYKKEILKLAKLKKKELEEAKKLEVPVEESGEEPETALFTYILSENSNLQYSKHWKMAHAMRFGQPLVFDMSYEEKMNPHSLRNCIKQLVMSKAWNRRQNQPFHIHFCNLDPQGGYQRELVKFYGAQSWDQMLITTTERGAHEIFPKKDIVYLTADSKTVLRRFDHSAVYVVGALVDGSSQTGVSYAHARRLSLSTARLPLDEHLHWKNGSKSLTLNQMTCILSTLQNTGSWEKALSYVPNRKHQGFLNSKGKKINT